jgi:hypothetical protein
MKTKVVTLLIAAAFLTAGITSCRHKKDDPQPASVKEMLINKKWLATSMTIDPGVDIDGDGKIDTDWMQFIEDCEKDDLTVFADDGELLTLDGAVKCGNAGNPPSHWELSDNNTRLKVTFEGETEMWDIVSITATSLKVKFSYNVEGKNVVMTATFKNA